MNLLLKINFKSSKYLNIKDFNVKKAKYNNFYLFI